MGERKGTKGLELWCRRMTEGYPGVSVVNMTTSWRDGLAFCAIIHHFRPDLIEFSKLNKDDIYYNNDLAFRTAEHHLGIPALLEPEDMVEFAVPDRLSILTYLSQFYQTFVVSQGKSPARIAAKRAAASPEHSLVSPASSSPPTKVAFPSAGKIRREPCAKCGLPVFIAERLNVGKLLYHRTCFRCARCNSQLTLANYYETENNEFCCETCPDEEKSHFNQPDSSVLTRSLSDEEKSASLKKSEEDDYSAKFETALEYPKDDSLKRSSTLSNSQYQQARSFFFGTQVQGVSDSGNEDEPPDLPKTKPPARAENVTAAASFSDSGFPKNKPKTHVNIGSSVSVSNTSSRLEKSHDIVTKDAISAEGNASSLVKARMRLFETKSDAPNETHSVNNKVPLQLSNSAVEVGRNNKGDSKHSFKDSTLNKNSSRGSLSLRNSPEKEASKKKNTSRESVSLRSSPVKEASKKKDTSREIVILRSSPEIEASKKKDTSRESVILRNSPEKEASKKKDTSKESSSLRNSPQKEVSRTSPTKQSQLDAAEISVIEITDDSIITISDATLEDSRNIQSFITSSDFSMKSDENEKSPEPFEETPPVKQIPDDLSKHDESTFENLEENKLIHQNQINIVRAGPEIVEPQVAEVKTSPNVIYQTSFLSSTPEDAIPDDEEDDANEYPDDLNPFGDDDAQPEEAATKAANVSLNPFDDEEDEAVVAPTPRPATRRKIRPVTGDADLSAIYIQRVSVNPFEDDEDVEEAPRPTTRKVITAPRISLNPFWSDDEENDDAQPVPKPRLSKTPGAPEPKPRESGLSSSTNFGSSSSLASSQGGYTVKKKKPAPRPPLFTGAESGPSSVTSSPGHSVTHSPRSTPKLRKTKKAPLPPTSTPIYGSSAPLDIDVASLGDDFENEKIAKDELNRNRQSQNISLLSPSSSENSSSLNVPNKSTHGKWKRKKGQAPSLPIPQRRSTKSVPLIEVRRELELIEIQQQGLEKQGVRLEHIIRERCEVPGNSPDDSLPPEIEEMVLQLFELVNEKNELFRRQAELMYLRRQHKLEEEHADIEYQIRCLMLQPEANKTDSDKAREEELINRLVEIVERRNEIIECLEMDRVREAEEDDSINNQLNLYTLKKEEEAAESKNVKKEKKKHKKEKKAKSKGPKIDADKDIDESEGSTSSVKDKKKKKFNLF